MLIMIMGGIRCFTLTRTTGAAGTPVYQYPAGARETPSGTSHQNSAPAGGLSDVSVFIYVANYTGGIRVNGREFKTFEEERDMQYNYNNFGEDFSPPGENTTEVDYAPLLGLSADHWLLQIHLKVSRGDMVIGEWKIAERTEGAKTFTLDIAEWRYIKLV